MNKNSQYISEKNKHIEEFLNDYSKPETVPNFAVLLKGEWGCGKSWFINEYIEKLKKQYKEKQNLYIKPRSS